MKASSSKERIIYDAVWSQYPRMVDPSRIWDCNAGGRRVTAPKCCFCRSEHFEHFWTQNWNLVRASWVCFCIFMLWPFVPAVIATTTFLKTIQMLWYLHWCSFFKSFSEGSKSYQPALGITSSKILGRIPQAIGRTSEKMVKIVKTSHQITTSQQV